MFRSLCLSAIFAVGISCVPTLANAACVDGKDRNVTIINDSSRTIERFYATNSLNTSWGKDRIKYLIEPGEELTVDMDDGSCRCEMDLLAITTVGTRFTRRNYDVCNAEKWRLVN